MRLYVSLLLCVWLFCCPKCHALCLFIVVSACVGE